MFCNKVYFTGTFSYSSDLLMFSKIQRSDWFMGKQNYLENKLEHSLSFYAPYAQPCLIKLNSSKVSQCFKMPHWTPEMKNNVVALHSFVDILV